MFRFPRNSDTSLICARCSGRSIFMCYRKAKDGQTVNFFRRSAVDLLINQFWISNVASNDFQKYLWLRHFQVNGLTLYSFGKPISKMNTMTIRTTRRFRNLTHVPVFLIMLHFWFIRSKENVLGYAQDSKRCFFSEVRYFIMSVRGYFYLCHKSLHQSILQVHFFSCADEDFPDRVKESVNKFLTQRDIFWRWKSHVIHLFFCYFFT